MCDQVATINVFTVLTLDFPNLSVAAQRERSETKSNERGLALLRVQISFWINLQEVSQTKWSQMNALVARLFL